MVIEGLKECNKSGDQKKSRTLQQAHLGRKNKRGDGICLYVHNSVSVKTRNDLSISNEDIESLCIEIIIIKKNCYCLHLLCTTTTKVKPLKNHVGSIINKIKRENKKLFLLGDFNIKSLQQTQK